MWRNVNFARGSPTSAAATGTQTNGIQQILTSPTLLEKRAEGTLGSKVSSLLDNDIWAHGLIRPVKKSLLGKNLPDVKQSSHCVLDNIFSPEFLLTSNNRPVF